MMTIRREITPRRETLRPVKAKENDTRRAHHLLAEIVHDHGQGDRQRFTQALVVRLHAMRLSPSVLLTPEGFDAVSAVAAALDDWRELASSRQQTLSKAWSEALRAVGVQLSKDDRSFHTTSRFTNNIRVR